MRSGDRARGRADASGAGRGWVLLGLLLVVGFALAAGGGSAWLLGSASAAVQFTSSATPATTTVSCPSGWYASGNGCGTSLSIPGDWPVTVPPGVATLNAFAHGASGDGLPDTGGPGGEVSGDLSVVPGEEFTAIVGSPGGATNPFGGGGAAGGAASGTITGSNCSATGPGTPGYGGGGGSFVYGAGGLILAAGGGGGASGAGELGGAGGYPAGAAGTGQGGSGGGGGGGATGPGQPPTSGGAYGTAGHGPASASPGQGGQGGAAALPDAYGGGGGGGGYYGGAGGSGSIPEAECGASLAAGGGGGSSYLSPLLTATKSSVLQYSSSSYSGDVTFSYQFSGGTISGTIVTPFNEGLPGITVQLTGTTSASTTTASDGTYSFPNLPSGSYTVTPVVPTGQGPDEFTPTECDNGKLGTNKCVNMALGSSTGDTGNFTAGYTLTGSVTDLQGSAVQGATVLISDTEQKVTHKVTATTNASGEIATSSTSSTPGVKLAPGELTVAVDVQGNTYYGVPSAGNDPDCVPSGSSCQVNLNRNRITDFRPCIVPDPNGSALPSPYDTSNLVIPGSVTSGNLEAVGCWKPTDSNNPDTANTFESTAPVRLDGLDLEPAGLGTTFALNKSARLVTIEGKANLRIGGLTIWQYSNGSKLTFGGLSVGVEDLGLGEAYGGPKLGGLPLAVGTGGPFGSLFPSWLFSAGQTSLTVNPVVPVTNQATRWDWSKGEFQNLTGDRVPNAGPQFTFTTTNREGFLWSNTPLCWTFGDQTLTPWQAQAVTDESDWLVLNGITACLNLHTLEWSLSGILELGEITNPEGIGPDRASVSVTLKKFDLEKISTQVDGFNQEVAPYVFFQRVGLDASWDLTKQTPIPSTVDLNGGVSFGPQLNEKTIGEALIKKYPFLEGAELASADMSGAVVLSTPFEISFKGTIYMFRRTPIQMALAGGFVNWWPTTNQFSWGGDLTRWPIAPLVRLDANFSGWLAVGKHLLLDPTTYQLQGHGELVPLVGPSLSVDALANNNVVMACSPNFGAGYVYTYELSHGQALAPGTCGLGAYALPNPTPGAARDGAANAPLSFRIPAGLASTVLAVSGKTKPPRLTLTGPKGESVTTPSSDWLVTKKFWVSQDAATRTTYVAIAHPGAGDWTIHVNAGSSAISKVREANPAPSPQITAKVSSTGCRQQVSYNYRPVSGDKVFLYAEGGAQRTFLGYARPGKHELSFAPSLRGTGQLVAMISQRGVPNPDRILATFSPAAFRRASTPSKLRVHGRVLSWTAGCGASYYTVTVANGSTSTTRTTRTTHVTIPTVHGRYTVTVYAFTASGSRTSATAHFRRQ